MLQLQQLSHKIAKIDLSYYDVLIRNSATFLSSRWIVNNSFLDGNPLTKIGVELLFLVLSFQTFYNKHKYISRDTLYINLFYLFIYINYSDACTFEWNLFASLVSPP